MISISHKINILRRLYEVYNEFAKTLKVACAPICPYCCTGNVTMTTLEGYQIITYMSVENKNNLMDVVRNFLGQSRFRPRFTTNMMVKLCIDGKDIPEEAMPQDNVCPLLIEDQCSIYPVRPFGCRSFFSKHDCKELGYATCSDYMITVNQIFLQYIEHIDPEGFFGNLTDILIYMSDETNRNDYISGNKQENANFIGNCSIPKLMIPPEHRKEFMKIFELIKKAF